MTLTSTMTTIMKKMSLAPTLDNRYDGMCSCVLVIIDKEKIEILAGHTGLSSFGNHIRQCLGFGPFPWDQTVSQSSRS